MAFLPDTRAYPGAPAASQSAALDAGLRSYMLRVYNWMASGLVLTGIVAYGIVNVPALFDAFYPLVQTPRGFVHTPGALAYIAMFAPLAFTLVLSFGINKLSHYHRAGAVLGLLRRDGRQPHHDLPGLHA